MSKNIPEREITQEEQEIYTKKFQSLTIKDDFMFCHVMQDAEICEKVLNILLQDCLKIGKIKLVKPQETIENHPELKFVRLDVLATDEDGNSYDIEMQVVNRKNIEKRMRAYQAAIDMSKLQRGMGYNELTNTVIIFITPFDPFGEGDPLYLFEYCAAHKPDIKMRDGGYRLVVNASAHEKVENEKLRELVKFFYTGKATVGVAKEMKMKIDTIKKDNTLFYKYFSTYAALIDARDDGRAEGREEGREEGIAKGRKEGRAEGRKEGMAKGRKEGMAKGRKEGRAEGSASEKIATAQKMKAKNCDIAFIAEITGLSRKEIEKI